MAKVEWADVGDAVTFHGEPGQVVENDAQTLLVDLDPRRVCSGNSGRPIYKGSGNAVGLVSRSGGGRATGPAAVSMIETQGGLLGI